MRYTQEINQHDLNSNCLLIEPDVEPWLCLTWRANKYSDLEDHWIMHDSSSQSCEIRDYSNLSTWHLSSCKVLIWRDSLHQVLTVSLLITLHLSVKQVNGFVLLCIGFEESDMQSYITCALPNAYIVSMPWLHSVCLNIALHQ